MPSQLNLGAATLLSMTISACQSVPTQPTQTDDKSFLNSSLPEVQCVDGSWYPSGNLKRNLEDGTLSQAFVASGTIVNDVPVLPLGSLEANKSCQSSDGDTLTIVEGTLPGQLGSLKLLINDGDSSFEKSLDQGKMNCGLFPVTEEGKFGVLPFCLVSEKGSIPDQDSPSI